MNQEYYFLDNGTVLVRVPGYLNYYANLERGLIYSVRTGDRIKRLKTYERPGKHNYVTATLTSDDGVARCMGVHEVIMAAHEQSWAWKQLDYEVNHKNEKKNQNWIDNLEIVDRRGQYTESVRAKMAESKRGSRHPMSKLTEEDVMDIRMRFEQWNERKSDFVEMIANEYDVSFGCINGIIYGYTWQHVI